MSANLGSFASKLSLMTSDLLILMIWDLMLTSKDNLRSGCCLYSMINLIMIIPAPGKLNANADIVDISSWVTAVLMSITNNLINSLFNYLYFGSLFVCSLCLH